MNAFLSTFADLEKGKAASDISDALTELVAACKDVGKKGELSIKLTLRPGGDDTVRFAVEFNAKTPKRDRKETTFFVTEDNQLTRDNPKQAEIEFNAVIVPSAEEQLKKAQAGK